MTDLIVLLIFVLALLGYVLPAIVAYRRLHRNFGAILIANVLLGWTGLGWVVVLVWSCTDNTWRAGT